MARSETLPEKEYYKELKLIRDGNKEFRDEYESDSEFCSMKVRKPMLRVRKRIKRNC